MIATMKSRVVVFAIAIIMAFTAFASLQASPAEAHGGGHYAADYSAWLAECYYGGWSWYDYYYHYNTYYWYYC